MVLRTRGSQLPILITGESGTGKDHLARWIHALSPRAKSPFVAQDCAAIPEELFEADVFGYETGAFTGAERSKTGYIFAAEGGSYYLDNVDALSLVAGRSSCASSRRGGASLGGHASRKTDVRIMASSQRDLKDLPPRRIPEGLLPPDRHLPHIRPCENCGGHPEISRRSAADPGAPPCARRHGPFRAYSPGNVRELESVVRGWR